MYRKKKFLVVLIAVCITAILFVFSVIDPEPEQPTITIRGEKPEGAKVELWVRYFLSGDQCETYSYNLLKMERKRGGITKVNFTEEDNLSKSTDEYKYNVVYQPYLNSKHCLVELASVQIKAYNNFDSESKGGFAELNLNNIDSKSINRNNNDNPIAESKNCNADISLRPNKTWFRAIVCDFYIHDRIKKKKMGGNYRARFNFSNLKPNQEVVYNIIPGPDYKDGHFNEQTGKFDDE